MVFIATAWGPKYGGINQFNYHLALAVASGASSDLEVVCVCLEAISDDAVDVAKKNYNLTLIALNLPPDLRLHADKIATLIGDSLTNARISRVSHWLGHDVITGFVAINCRNRAKNGRVAVVHHMNYEAYQDLKAPENAERTIHQHEMQREVLRTADLVFAVGPTLARSARNLVRGTKTHVVTLYPGFPEFSMRREPTTDRFAAICFGRLGGRDDYVKQASLAIAAYAQFVRTISTSERRLDLKLTVVGLSSNQADIDKELKALHSIASKYAGRRIPISASPFIDNPEQLHAMLVDSDVSMMLSVHEGFGLTGLEAIAAEVPLIVSKNTGLYETIDKQLGGPGRGCLEAVDIKGPSLAEPFNDADVTLVADTLHRLSARTAGAHSDAQKLREQLANICDWKKTAGALALELGLPFRQQLSELESEHSDLLASERLKAHDMLLSVGQRGFALERALQAIREAPLNTQRLIIFGGIASTLCTQASQETFRHWLHSNPKAALYICFETDEALKTRATSLDPSKLPVTANRPNERLTSKLQKVFDFKTSLLADTTISSRIFFIPVPTALSSYVQIDDTHFHLTPLFSKRSTESMAWQSAISDSNSLWRDVLDYISLHLGHSPEKNFADSLLRSLAVSPVAAAPAKVERHMAMSRPAS